MKYKLRNTYSLNPQQALTEILIDRGVENIEQFMYPTEQCELNPYDLENITQGAQMLLKHLRAQNKILFVQDPDFDGVTSTAILWLYIKDIFPNADLNFVLHDHKQHGIDDKIDEIEDNPIYQLIICPDSSSYHIIEQNRLNDLGIDCLILDHHEQLYDKEGNPIIATAEHTIVINNQLSPKYSNKSLCGAGVVYKFCEVLDDMLGIKKAQNYLDLVAVGEIADVMDRRTSETNYLITEGLSCIKNKGLKILLESQSYSLKEKAVEPYINLTPIDIAFYIAPLINAITRVGTMAEKEASLYCFIEPDKLLPSTKRGAKPGDMETAAEQTARVGKNAKARQDKLKEKAIDLIDFKIQKNNLLDNNIIIVELDEDDNIPQELSGLVAMGIVNKYNRPCLIVRRNSDNLLQGSARGNSNFSNLHDLKSYLENSGYFEYVAGHNNAFGAGIKSSKLNSFLSFANTNLSKETFENCYIVDYILDAKDNNAALVAELSSHPEYFGNHIDEIKFVFENIPLTYVMAMGANKDSMKISCNGIDFVRFKDVDFAEQVMLNRTSTINIYGRGNLNYFNGKMSIQIFIDDYDFTHKKKIDPHKYDF